MSTVNAYAAAEANGLLELFEYEPDTIAKMPDFAAAKHVIV